MNHDLRSRQAPPYYVLALLLCLTGSLLPAHAEAAESSQKKEETAFKKGSADYFYNQGNASKNKGDIGSAIKNWTLAIEQNPELVEAYYNRGGAYARQNIFQGALADFDKVIQLARDPKMKALAYYNKGLVSQNQNDLKQALSGYTLAIETDPSYAPAYKNRAVVYLFEKNYDASWKDARRSEELGLKCNPAFIRQLQQASGKQK
ncbi:MAG: tetratricopeptide repeat protein [Candidatus Omnitrophota bacterium]